MKQRCPFCRNNVKFNRNDYILQCPECSNVLKNSDGNLILIK